MLEENELKAWLHRKEFTQTDKLLLALSTFDQPCNIKELKDRTREAGLKIDKWNPGARLGASAGRAINTPNGWEITDAGRQYLRQLGVGVKAPAASKIRHDLRAELSKIKDPDTRAFVDEAIKCFEFDLYRSAVVMAWLAAMDVLHNHVHAHHLNDFNSEAARVDAKWKPAKTTDDFGRMKEHEFLDRLVAISVIGKNVRQQLGQCLTLRNGCGHPNSLALGANTVASHFEILLMNVFKVF